VLAGRRSRCGGVSGETDVEIERFLGNPGDPDLIPQIKADLKAGNVKALATDLPRLIDPGLDYTTANLMHRQLGQLRKKIELKERKTKVAFLGSFTIKPLADLLDLFLFARRVGLDLYEADYGTFRQEILDPDSGLHRFRPEFLILATTWRDLGRRPDVSDDREVVEQKVKGEVAEWESLWRATRGLGCQIIQNNFDAPPWRIFGNLESRHPAGFSRFIEMVNQELQDAAPPYVTIHDIDHLAAAWGRWQWGDERYFFHAKLPCSPTHLIDYAHSMASLIFAHLGLSKKCLVLDLDNTLWGGVIGDDGLGGIRIGQGDPESEAFAAFQRYVLGLQRRGVILAVCSKNTESIAKEAFEKHPEMALRLHDISCFVANWDDKATNLGRIAERLNIGLDSLVFVDDNPAERSIIRRLRPEVAVPEMPEDPAYFVSALERHRYFQATAMSSEDLQRTAFYRSDQARQAMESTAEDLEGFLRSLELVGRIAPINAATLERSVQLIHRSNQFNVTTRRHGAAEVQAMMDSPAWLALSVSLKDRFGDNGLIAVLLAKVDIAARTLFIDTWLMSCRVLKRGVEQYMLNRLVELAEDRALVRLVATYIPTAKNGIVKDLFADLGFNRIDQQDDGQTRWELPLTGRWQPLLHFIKEQP
jgi:FkbH-like protein